MEATDIISIEDAKEWLSASDEMFLKRLIGSSINFVEEYTGHALVSKQQSIEMDTFGYAIKQYPMTIVSVKDKSGNSVNYKTAKRVYNTFVFAPVGSIITIDTGYSTVDAIPGMLVEVAYKMLTYLFENRDIYVANLPLDFQVMVNKFRRNLV